MAQFHLKIVTPDGSFYDGEAEMLSLRTAEEDLGNLANHIRQYNTEYGGNGKNKKE